MNGQHYFINSVNFCNYFDKLYIDTISAVLKSSTESSLAKWFVDSYIQKCAKLCPDTVPLACSNLITNEISTAFLSAIMQWRDHVCNSTLVKHSVSFIISSLIPWLSCFKVMSSERQSIVQDQTLSPIALSFPQIDGHSTLVLCHMLMTSIYIPRAYRTLTYDLVAHIICGSCSSADERCKLRCFSLKSSAFHRVSHFQKAAILMELVAKKHPSTHRLLLIELSKLSLQRALRCNNSGRNIGQCMALVYLSVLFYTTGQCQMAIYHVTLTTKFHHNAECCKHSMHVVEGKLLPKIDDSIDCALGLVVFYRYILTVVFNKQHRERVGVFTLDLFAHYFTLKHLLVAKCHCMPEARDEDTTQTVQWHLHEELKSCFSAIESSKHFFTCDLLLCKLSTNSCCHERTVIATQNSFLGSDIMQIANLITQCSLQQLLTYRHLMPHGYMEPIKASNRSDLMMLYLYRCQLYEQCAQLCRQKISHMITVVSCNFSHMSIVYNEFIEMMDDDVVSAIGLSLLLRKTGHQSLIRGHVTITQLTLSFYLLTKSLSVLKSPDDLGTLANMLDWIANALMTIKVSEYVDYLMLKLAERHIVSYITWTISGNTRHSPRAHVGECEVGIIFDAFGGLQLKFTPASNVDDICDQLENGDNTAWVCNNIVTAGPRNSVAYLNHLRKDQGTDAHKESLPIKMQLRIALKLLTGLLRCSGSSYIS